MTDDLFFSTGGVFAVQQAMHAITATADDCIAYDAPADHADWLLSGCGLDAPLFMPAGCMVGVTDTAGDGERYTFAMLCNRSL